jgi:type I restriction enzyme M protein
VRTALKKAGVALTGPQLKTLVSGLSARDEEGEISTNAKGVPESDPDLRDTENVPLTDDVQEYFEREVLPFAPDAWIDEAKTKVGYDLPFTGSSTSIRNPARWTLSMMIWTRYWTYPFTSGSG